MFPFFPIPMWGNKDYSSLDKNKKLVLFFRISVAIAILAIIGGVVLRVTGNL